jgi:hypothetical protein
MTIAAKVLARDDEVIEQNGDFRSWPKADLPLALKNVRFRIKRTSALSGAQHLEVLALFRTMDPRLKRIVMSHGAEVIAQQGDIKTAVQLLLAMSQAVPPR